MNIFWADAATRDVVRLHAFLAPVAPDAADRAMQMLYAAPDRLVANPRLGSPLPDYLPREIRRLKVGRYEMRYEVRSAGIEILRIWHEREDRPFGPQ